MMGSGDGPGFKLFGTTIQTEEDRPTKSAAAEEATAVVSDIAEETAAAKATGRALACPRCKSKETKFCYFNNYNVNQPRHFCKACHRYWTAGGTLRNVPVGAGRRKNRTPPPSRAAAGGICIAGVEEVERWLLRHHDHLPAERSSDGIR